MNIQALRIARATDDFEAVLRFYRDGLGFTVIGSFTDHDGFDEVMLGKAGCSYHLEFTRNPAHPAGRAPTQENLLVFYIPDCNCWSAATLKMSDAGYAPVASLNPYWDGMGKTSRILMDIEWSCKTQLGADRLLRQHGRHPGQDAREDFFGSVLFGLKSQSMNSVAEYVSHPGR